MAQPSKSKDRSSARGRWHNNFFNSHFENPQQIRSLLQLAIPARQLGQFDLDSITVKKSSLPDAAELREYLSDLTIDVRLNSGDHIVVSVLIEHKSGQDPGLMRQLLVYMARQYAKDALAVLPVTLYHGRSRWKREKSFHAFQHENLPSDFLDAFKDYLIDFRTIFINLRDDAVRRRLVELPLKERLALQTMADIWEADQYTFADWLEQILSLPREGRRDIVRSFHNYFAHTHRSVTMIDVEKALQTKRSGARTMQERQHLDEIIKEWNGVMPQSIAEAESRGEERGEKRGEKRGEEKGARQAVCEMAERLIQDGKSDLEIQRYTKLSAEEIKQLRNGG